MIAVGESHSLALKCDGTVWAWGANFGGELGDGTTINRATPVQVSGLIDVIAIAGSRDSSLALKSDGTVWAWGSNNWGQLGNNTAGSSVSTPIPVLGLNGIVAIAGGLLHALALKSDGTVWAWGYNENGQLGDGTTANRPTPVQVTSISSVVAIAAADHSMALKSDGTVWTWGSNASCQLGDYTIILEDQNAPVQVKYADDEKLTGVVAIAAGTYHSMALKSDGTALAWGSNSWDQLGDGSGSQKATPVQVSSLSGLDALAAGAGHSLALKSGGTAWAWGYNSNGSIGDGTTINRRTPVQVSDLSDVVMLAAGSDYSLALKSDGTVWAWGRNLYGRLGTGTSTNSLAPVKVQGPNGIGWLNLGRSGGDDDPDDNSGDVIPFAGVTWKDSYFAKSS
jgi:alpha-tubulin suppressor-like RCC1 family protein